MFNRPVAPLLAGLIGLLSPCTLAKVVSVYDARPLQRLDVRDAGNARRVWDEMQLLAALQGLANRAGPRFYVRYCSEFGVDTDTFWWDWFRGEDGWLRDADVRSLDSIEQVLETFRSDFAGLVVYDENVAATASLACTAAGVERLLPVRFDPAPHSLYSLCTGRLSLPVRLRLVREDGAALFTGRGLVPDLNAPSSGSAKVDAYRWAMARWLKTGRCDPHAAAYYLDGYWLRHPGAAQPDMHTLSNHDWFIAHRAFFFDLSPWGDEAPVDDAGQPPGADKRCLLEILRTLHDGSRGGMIKIGGFPPWPFKYTTHAGAGRHEPVATEWEYTRLISQFNAFQEADAAGPGAMANASFCQHYPLKARYRQPNPKPGAGAWMRRGLLDPQRRIAPRLYVGHYVGDYDAPSWLYKAVPAFFSDPARGRVPLAWAFDPNLADRAPQALAYAYRHASTNDFFIAGDSGAGYLNPRALTVRPDSGLDSGLAVWQAHCRRFFSRWDMTITGFVLDGAAGRSTAQEFTTYAAFSPDGCGTHFDPGPAVQSGVPTCPERDLPDTALEAAKVIGDAARRSGGQPSFLWARSILKPPRWYDEVARRLREEHPQAAVEFVDPYTFFGLIRLQFAPAR